MHLGWFEQGVGFPSPAHAVGGQRRLLKPGAFLLRGLLLLVLSWSAPASAEVPGTAFVLSQFNPHAGALVLALTLLVVALLLCFGSRLRGERARRQSIENEAADAKRRLNAILNNAGVGVLLADGQGRFVDVNYRWCRMFGYQRREARGKLMTLDITHPDEAASIGNLFRAMLAGEIRSRTREYRFVRKDGSVFWGLISTSLVKDGLGQSLWVVGMIADIDKQKQVEAKLRESEESLRFMTENTCDVVWQLDRELRFTFVNGADERMRGVCREEVIGRPLSEQLAPGGRQTLALATQRQLESAQSLVERFEVEMLCKSGGRVWVEINSTPIHDAASQIVGYIGVARDATERREAQKVLREQSIRDPLTGLYNRRYLDESLARELSRAKRDGLPLSLLMVDIDYFKKLNDSYGHQAGDEVLKRLGELIGRGARSGDLPCRYGGEEFLLVLPTMSLESAVERADQWRLAFADEKIPFANTLLSATLSIGVATCPEHGTTSEKLIGAADQALYAAKHAGRNRIAVAGT